jgi:hypothetical protein
MFSSNLSQCYLNMLPLLISLNASNTYSAYVYKLSRSFLSLDLLINAVKTFRKLFMMFALSLFACLSDSGVLVCENFPLIKPLYLNIIVFHI